MAWGSSSGTVAMWRLKTGLPALEAMCGGLAARRVNTSCNKKIRVAHEACRGVKDPDTYYTLNELFHGALYEASQNDFLIEKVRRIERQVRPYRRLQLRVRSRLADSFHEHQEIVDATLAAHSDLAAERLRAHVNVQGQRFSDLMASSRAKLTGWPPPAPAGPIKQAA